MDRVFLPRLTKRDLEEISRANIILDAAGQVLKRSNVAAAPLLITELGLVQGLLCRLYNHAESVVLRALGTSPTDSDRDVAPGAATSAVVVGDPGAEKQGVAGVTAASSEAAGDPETA